MNISPIGFKGTFCLSQADFNNKKCRKMQPRIEEYEITFETSGYTNPGKIYAHMPHQFDAKFEKLMKKLSITHERIEESDSLDPDNIVARMVINSHNKSGDKLLQKINTKKLDSELRKMPELYIGYNGANGSSYRYDRFKSFLKTNQEILSPIVYLKRLDNGEIETHIYDGRHRFAVLRDMGIEQIPVTIDKESLELAKEIGLV